MIRGVFGSSALVEGFLMDAGGLRQNAKDWMSTILMK